MEVRVKDSKTEVARAHAAEYVRTFGNIFAAANSAVLAFPNRLFDPAKLPVNLDLGGITAVIETYPGHIGTDIIVRVPEQNVVYAGDFALHSHVPGYV
jgi:glyoxylase-like metal-dependent hydrolase (beta-lactamase superfamily II)